MFASRKRVTDVSTPLVVGAVVPGAAGQPMIAPNAVQTPSASNQQKLELAKRLASQINMARNLGPEADNTQQVAAAIMRGDMSAPQISVNLH
jgi:ATP-dependent RNA helicase DDX46/PRP5